MGLSKTSIFLIFAAIAAFVCGVIGFGLNERVGFLVIAGTEKTDVLGKFLDAVYRTLQLYVLSSPGNGLNTLPTDANASIADYLKNIARFLAPISLGGAIINGLKKFFIPYITRLRMYFMRNHVIIFGNGNIAENFLENAITKNHRIIHAHNSVEEGSASVVESQQSIIRWLGNWELGSLWNQVAAQRAHKIILADENDQKNLEAATAIYQLLHGNDENYPKLYIHVNNNQFRKELIHQTRAFNIAPKLKVSHFNVSELSSRLFFHNRDFFWEAMKRNQDRIHWLIIKPTEVTLTFIKQFLSVCSHPHLLSPKITIVSEQNDSHARDLASILENCSAHLEHSFVSPTEFHTLLGNSTSTNFISAPITAVLVGGKDQGALQTALALRKMSHRNPLLKAPIILSDFQSDSVDRLINDDPFLHTNNGIRQLVKLDEVCTLETLDGEVDRIATYIHNNYLADLTVRDPIKFPSHKSWNELEENFRDENRRAADHLKTKLEALNMIGKISFHRKIDFDEICPELFEALSRCEHESWVLNRTVNGWKYAESRDDTKMYHPDLVEYDELDETAKEKDRNQIKSLMHLGRKRSSSPAMKSALSIGLIGRNLISQAEAEHIHQKLQDDVFPTLFKKHSDRILRFFTPLAPGSDLIAAQTLKRSIETSCTQAVLYLVETSSKADIVDAYAKDAALDHCWGLDKNATPLMFQTANEVSSALEEIDRQHQRISIINIPTTTFSEELSINSKYFGQNMDLLIAYEGNTVSNGPFGTKETLNMAKDNGIAVITI